MQPNVNGVNYHLSIRNTCFISHVVIEQPTNLMFNCMRSKLIRTIAVHRPSFSRSEPLPHDAEKQACQLQSTYNQNGLQVTSRCCGKNTSRIQYEEVLTPSMIVFFFFFTGPHPGGAVLPQRSALARRAARRAAGHAVRPERKRPG